MVRKLIAGLLVLLFLGEGLVPIAAAVGGAGAAAGSGAGATGGAVSGADAGASLEAGRAARVSASSLNLRGGPGTEHAIIRSLPRDTRVTVLAVEGEWSQLRLGDGTTGWAATKYLEALPEDAGDASRDGSDAGRSSAGAGEGGDRSAARATGDAGDRSAGRSGGGLSLRSIAKWGCLAGALVAGGLAYSAHAGGNDAYDEYKELYQAGELDASEAKYQDALDRDDQAQVLLIGAGALAGLFLLQQFVLGGGGEGDQAMLDAPAARWDARRGEVRLALVRIRL